MLDDKTNKLENLKPQGVKEDAAEAYLSASGWVESPLRDAKWLAPVTRLAYSRGPAVVRQFQEDFLRLAFVMQHLPPEFLMLLVPPVIIEKIKETVEQTILAQMAKEAEKSGPSN